MTNTHADKAQAALREVVPPAGRARFTNPQMLQIAQVEATLALVQEARTANMLAALAGGPSFLDHDTTATSNARTAERKARANLVRSVVRDMLDLPNTEAR